MGIGGWGREFEKGGGAKVVGGGGSNLSEIKIIDIFPDLYLYQYNKIGNFPKF